MRRIYTCFLLACVAAVSAGAAVLVTTDGTEIEIRGAWQQKGKMVVFTLANGQLSALRAEDVDFEATQRRTDAASAPAVSPRPAPPKPTSRIVITDADVAHVSPEEIAVPSESADDGAAVTPPGDASAEAGGEADSASESASQVRVIAWDQEDPADGDGRVIFGTLRNDGNTFATDIALEISVFEDEGALVGTQSVAPVKTSLRPGESTTFRAQFRDVFAVGATRMSVSSLQLDVGAAENAPSDSLDG